MREAKKKHLNSTDTSLNVAPTAHSSCPAADRRLHRYVRWLDDTMGGYPQGIIDKTDHQFVVRMLSVLDCAVLLLSDRGLGRILRLLEHLDKHGYICARDAAIRLLELGERDFFWFLARQFVAVAENGNRSLEEMVTRWHQAFCFQAQPGHPTGVITSDGAFLGYEKPYRGLLIDRDLDEAQMDRLNSVPGIKITSTCAGHPELFSPPAFCYTTKGGEERFTSRAPFENTGRNSAEVHDWWEQAITALERMSDGVRTDADSL